MQTKKEVDILQFIKTSLLKNKDVEISLKTQLFKERLVDSMNILKLIGYVENKLNRKLSDNEIVMKNFESAGSIIETFFNGPKK